MGTFLNPYGREMTGYDVSNLEETISKTKAAGVALLAGYDVSISVESGVKMLDWSKCPILQSNPKKLSGARTLRATRMPVVQIMESLASGLNIDQILESYPGVERKDILGVLQFITDNLRDEDDAITHRNILRSRRAQGTSVSLETSIPRRNNRKPSRLV